MFDNLLFIIFPYAAFLLAIVVTIQRYLKKGFTYSSLSSQFLESDELFYGSVPWHYGILAVLAGHLIGFLCPTHVLRFNAVPLRLYLLESTALLCGLLSLVGLVNLIVRRHLSARIRAVTSPMDVIILFLLLLQVGLGVYIALFYRWGSSWYATAVVPYLRSMVLLQPDIRMLIPLPMPVKLHILNAAMLIVIFPFSRLVHMLVVPLPYFWRPYQLVIWNWDRKKIRKQPPLVKSQVENAALPVTSSSSPANEPALTR